MNKYFLKTYFSVFVTMLFVGYQSVQAEPTRTKSDLENSIVSTHCFFDDIMETSGKEIPTQILAKAKAVLFVSRFQISFVVGIKGGSGIAMLHDGKGNWSSPSFYSLAGLTAGIQGGVEHSDMVYLIMTDEGTRMLTGSAGDVSLDVGVVAGPVGRYYDGEDNPDAPIYAYSLSKGLFVGASVSGGVLNPHNDNNEVYYGKPISPLDILEGRAKMTQAAKDLNKKLQYFVYEGMKLNKNSKQRKQ